MVEGIDIPSSNYDIPLEQLQSEHKWVTDVLSALDASETVKRDRRKILSERLVSIEKELKRRDLKDPQATFIETPPPKVDLSQIASVLRDRSRKQNTPEVPLRNAKSTQLVLGLLLLGVTAYICGSFVLSKDTSSELSPTPTPVPAPYVDNNGVYVLPNPGCDLERLTSREGWIGIWDTENAGLPIFSVGTDGRWNIYDKADYKKVQSGEWGSELQMNCYDRNPDTRPINIANPLLPQDGQLVRVEK